MTEKRIAIVTGDVTIDWNLARSQTTTQIGALWDPDFTSRCYRQVGGSALLGEIIKEAAKSREKTAEVRETGAESGKAAVKIRKSETFLDWDIAPIKVRDGRATSPGAPNISHSYTICAVFTDPKKEKSYWRVKEFLGVDRTSEKPAEVKSGDQPASEPIDPNQPNAAPNDDGNPVITEPSMVAASGAAGTTANNEDDSPLEPQEEGEADLVIVDDANQGFRGSKSSWPKALVKGGETTWVILKLANPDSEKSALIKHLEKNFGNRVVVILTVNDLREKNLRISRELSWERSVYDLIRELEKKPVWLPKAGKCVVSFYNDGAVVFPDVNNLSEALLVYDPHSIEREWGQDHPGKMFGYTQCLTAGVTLSFLECNNFDSIETGLLVGLKGSRYLHKIGFENPDGENRGLPVKLKFPAGKVGGFLSKCWDIEEEKKRKVDEKNDKPQKQSEEGKEEREEEKEEKFVIQTVTYNQKDESSILRLKYPNAGEQIRDLAKKIVEVGHKGTLDEIPVAKFDKFIPLERGEIEGMRQIKTLMGEYHRSPSEKKPLSIAVFGAPGNGKSFAVESVAKSLSKDSEIEVKQFNLSQFSDPKELRGAFHQVRDEVLKAKMPLVFWDEFDTQLNKSDFGWLRYFLAPMQDGTFQHGQLTHSIGKAIFVFAGATCSSMEKFEKKAKKAVEQKGPDFLSRLKGFTNIPSINHEGRDLNPAVVIRRALLLRATLLRFATDMVQKKDKEEKLRIDDGVLYAFIAIPEFKHGVRSLESIVRMSFLTGKSFFDRSSLPAESQLDLHVDSKKFIRLLSSTEKNIDSRIVWNTEKPLKGGTVKARKPPTGTG